MEDLWGKFASINKVLLQKWKWAQKWWGPEILTTSKKSTVSDWNVVPNNYLTKPLITMDLSHRRLFSTDNVWYVSENNLQKILLSLMGYQQKAQRLCSCSKWFFSKIAFAIFHTKCEIKYDFVCFICAPLYPEKQSLVNWRMISNGWLIEKGLQFSEIIFWQVLCSREYSLGN